MPKTQDQWQVFDLVEGFQLSQAVAALHDLGILTALTKPLSAAELSRRYNLDQALLLGTLEFVAARTNLLRKSAGKFVVTRSYSAGARFLIDLYVGSYGANASRLGKLLREPGRALAMVNRSRHARAFTWVGNGALGILPTIVHQLGFNNLIDLGCGNGEFLLELARQNSSFVGWGLDNNPAMVRMSRARVRSAHLGRRLKFIKGDCENLSAAIPESLIPKIESVTACHVVNGMFKDGPMPAVKWLRNLREILPARPLLILDYYGRLGKGKRRKSAADPMTLVHDFAQLISGQGVPPADAEEWRSIYAQAKCRLAHVIEDKSTTRFIHILQL